MNMNLAKPRNWTTAPGALALLAAALALAMALALAAPSPASANSIPEPATTFYGRIWSAGAGEPFLATAGELRWTIRRSDGVLFTLPAQLQPLSGGEFSYRLN